MYNCSECLFKLLKNGRWMCLKKGHVIHNASLEGRLCENHTDRPQEETDHSLKFNNLNILKVIT